MCARMSECVQYGCVVTSKHTHTTYTTHTHHIYHTHTHTHTHTHAHTHTTLQAETQYKTEYVVNFTSCAVGCNLTRQDNVTCAVFRSVLATTNCSCTNSTFVQTRSLVTKTGTNFLGIIVFSVGFAVALSHGGNQGRAVIAAIATMGAAIMKLITLIMW